MTMAPVLENPPVLGGALPEGVAAVSAIVCFTRAGVK
jgi:hypothetical protein